MVSEILAHHVLIIQRGKRLTGVGFSKQLPDPETASRSGLDHSDGTLSEAGSPEKFGLP